MYLKYLHAQKNKIHKSIHTIMFLASKNDSLIYNLLKNPNKYPWNIFSKKVVFFSQLVFLMKRINTTLEKISWKIKRFLIVGLFLKSGSLQRLVKHTCELQNSWKDFKDTLMQMVINGKKRNKEYYSSHFPVTTLKII